MAAVKTESLKDNNSKSLSSESSDTTMTVEKQTSHPTTTKNRTASTKESNSGEAPTVSPTQLKVASGNNPPTSPKKNDSPTSKGPTGHPTRAITQQQQAKTRGNPWHRSPPTTSGSGSGSGSINKKGPAATNVSPEGANKSGATAGSSSTKDSSSRSIKIPKDEVSGACNNCRYLRKFLGHLLFMTLSS